MHVLICLTFVMECELFLTLVFVYFGVMKLHECELV